MTAPAPASSPGPTPSADAPVGSAADSPVDAAADASGPAHRWADLRLRALVVAAAVALLGAVLVVLPGSDEDSARPTAANPVTPGVFTGLGFDQCLTPSQSAMTAWRRASPFRAVGVYISGDSRACRSQPNLTASWVANQLAAGWHLLPITLGPQASCQPRFPRYSDDRKISAKPAGDYAEARAMGTAEATKTIAAAKALGLVPGSTMFYDLEGFDYGREACRESALRFLSAWTVQIRKLGYRSGVYSSVGSGIKVLERQRVTPLPGIVLPDQLWLARYDGKANTSSTEYLSDAGWPGNRIKQFQGGHNETWGGVTINIDRNYLDLRSAPTPVPVKQSPPPAPAAERHCGGMSVDLPAYVGLRRPSGSYTPPADQVRVLRCLLRERGSFRGAPGPRYNRALLTAVRAWRTAHGAPAGNGRWTRGMWMQVFATNGHPRLKPGNAGPEVRDVQRALNAAGARIPVSGRMDARTQAALKQWKARVGLPAGSVVTADVWRLLAVGRF